MATAQTPPGPQEPLIDQIKRTVVFLQGDFLETQHQNVGGELSTVRIPRSQVGTGFLIRVPLPDAPNAGLTYLVTARHMIREKLPNGQPGPYLRRLTVRYNLKSPDAAGRQWATVQPDVLDDRGDLAWFVHETDTIADVAILPVVPDITRVDYKTIGADLFVTSQLLTTEKVNENDEVLFTGLFTGYFGVQKNYPIVRHGRVALIPNEAMATDQAHPNKKTDIYLVDVFSFGGNSGSPVFLRLGGVRETVGAAIGGYRYYLLGVMAAFFPDKDVSQNSGIAAVVPSQKLLDILSGVRNRAYVAAQVASYEAKRGNHNVAEAKFQEAVSVLEKVAADSSQLAGTLAEYARFLERVKKPEEAKRAASQAQSIRAHPVAVPPQP